MDSHEIDAEQVMNAWFALAERVDALLELAGSDGLDVADVAYHLNIMDPADDHEKWHWPPARRKYTFVACVLLALADSNRATPAPIVHAGYGDGTGPAPSWAVPAPFDHFAAAHFPNRLEDDGAPWRAEG
jgi:hypothetical protein